MSNFYIADTHFGHKNIIRYDNRPFTLVEEMDDCLIHRWNAVVQNSDTVYILGDFSWYGEEKTIEILDKLNGKKVLILGNHDRISESIRKRFIKISNYMEISDGENRVVLSHYPIMFYNQQFRDAVHLYGHVHNSHQQNMCESWIKEVRELQAIPMRMFNVGCMMAYMDYTPRKITEILSEEV